MAVDTHKTETDRIVRTLAPARGRVSEMGFCVHPARGDKTRDAFPEFEDCPNAAVVFRSNVRS
jgi:hypothetical protein